MIIDRTREIVHRARHRLVLAFLSIEAYESDIRKINTDNFGVTVKERQARIKADEKGFLIQSACVFETDAECNPLIEKSPMLMETVRKELSDRMQSSVVQGLHGEDKKVIFESEDVILRATGLSHHIHIEFSQSASNFGNEVSNVPFAKLRELLSGFQEKLVTAGGRLASVDMEHKSAISASDYYRIVIDRLYPGRTASFGDSMIYRANRSLDQVGIPHIYDASRKLH